MSSTPPKLTLRDYQVETVDAVVSALDRGVRGPAVVLPTGAGKAQPLDEPVLTPDGWKTMGELRFLDEVIGSDGRPTAVIGVYPQGERPVMRVEFSDGSWTRCDPEHLWNARTKYDKADGKPYRTFTAAELAGRLQTDWYVPLVEPVQYPEADLPIHPYLLGVIIGDGGLSVEGRVMVTCWNSTAELARAVLPDGVTMKQVKAVNDDVSTWIVAGRQGSTPNPVMSALRKLGLMGTTAWHKFVPEIYKRASVDQRVALIQGMCDTDGYAEPGKGSVEWTTVSERLAEDMRELVNSLGGLAQIKVKPTTWPVRGELRHGSAFRLNIRPSAEWAPVKVARKRDAFVPNKRTLTRRIVSIEPDGVAEQVCIRVAAVDQLYITRHHLVTHNSVIIGALAARPEVQKRGRVLVLAHREELIEQNAAKVRMAAPDLRVGIVKAGRNEILADVISATVQTLSYESRRNQLSEVGLVVYDECHHATSPSSVKILNHFKVPAVGFTATMTRADKSALGEVWTEVVYSKDISWMIRRGYLCAVDGKRIKVAGLDLAKVKRMHGDYSEKALGEAIEGSMAPGAVARSYVEHAMGRQGILFAPTVSSAEVFAEALAELGVKVETIHGKLGPEERRAMLQRFRDGTTTILSSVGVLTEGTDLPMAEVAIMCRPTTNVGLYIQCVGRVLRLHPGKSRALVLDLVGVTSKHSLVSPVQLFGDDADEIERDVLDMERDETEADEGGAEPEYLLDGPLEAEEVDLFHGSQSAWLRTHDGTWFLPAGSRFIALLPGERGVGWHVVAMNRYVSGDSRWVARDVPELGYAMAYAEGDVTKAEAASVEKERAWRGGRVDHKMIKYARSIGVRAGYSMSLGELQAGITVEEASRRIDPIQRARLAKGTP